MTHKSRKIAAYIAALWVVAAVLFAYSLPPAPGVGWPDYLVFFALTAFAERWYVAVSKESGMSLSFAAHLAGAVLFGPAFAMVVAVSSLAVTDGVIRRAPARRTAFNMAQMAISVGLCGLVYQALKVPGPVNLLHDAPALALAALVYLLVNDSLVAGVVSMTGRSFLAEWKLFLAEWKLSFRDLLLPYASMGPLGALAACSYQISPWSLLYFPPLLLVVYNGFKLYVSLQSDTDRALVALADSIDRRDQYTYEHSRRVADRVLATARRLGLAPREIDMIVTAARVHDLGKIATDNRVLLKESTLTPLERKHIQEHAAEGDELAGQFSMFSQGRRVIRHHHERWDGSGYPDGLAAAEIPLGARIISVADSYDAMTSDRPYRRALSHETAVQELRNCAGTQFDPAIVPVFLEALDAERAAAAAAPASAAAASDPVFEDISERVRAHYRLRLTQLSVDRAGDLIHWTAPDGRLLYVSDSSCERYGYAREEMLAMTILDLDPSLTPAAWAEHWRQLKESGSLSFETTHRTKGGELFPIEVSADYVEHDGEEYNFAYARDISERKRAESELREAKEAAERANAELLATQRILELQARTDALTGVMNRRAILERLREEMARSRRYGTSLATAMIDIDHFKDVNDVYGHLTGDQVLREVVARTTAALRPYDGLGRFGGEEFLVTLPQVSGSQALQALERVRLAICSAPIEVSGQAVTVTVSIGAELGCDHSLDDVIRSADAALYSAKADGRNRVVVSASTPTLEPASAGATATGAV